ncbi:hypothetical protein [Methylococcus sp. EFPC2]|uniref:hypothetical protein n=1 Tax=Methylococcus sp. EFPC2 TaxID=2812648 RepID=UPI001967EBFB|nr:hypothetical protein [Methylococcus sp. EFPC2]QSA98046.1 hypothetical protein JWZ97_04285 [Methylococcus sp. EFPC2]
MSAIYSCTAEIHLPLPNAENHRVIEKLGRRLEWVCDAHIEQESASDGTVWLTVHCPEQNCAHAFIEDLDAAFAELARHAIEGFAVDYVYEGDRGADFHGPTPGSTAVAKQNWNFAKAAFYLEQEGIDLHRLLELPITASAVQGGLGNGPGS